jgi:ferrous iron transport protein A
MQSKVKATRLSDLSDGSTAVIAAVDESVEHLMELGFVPGVHITPTYSGPGGEPRVYELEGTLVALRRSAAHHISVSLTGDDTQEGE